MYVKDHMTKDPRTITPETSVSKALDIMQQNDFHRLPVVDAGGKLIGLITEGVISESSGSKTTSLDMYEFNYLLSRTTVKDIMITDVQTIEPDALVEEAATKMLKSSIAVLPVVDEAEKVVGIITENDIFAAFLDLLGYTTAGTRFVINVQKDHPGILEDVSGLFAAQKINLTNIAVYYTVRGVEVVVLAVGECSYMLDMLKAKGYNVTNMLVKQAEEKTGARE